MRYFLRSSARPLRPPPSQSDLPTPVESPPTKHARTDAPELDAPRMAKLRKDFEREIKNLVQEAKDNTVVMEKFEFKCAESNKKQRDVANIPQHEWMDGTARCAISSDGVPLIFHLPGAMKEKSTKILIDQLIQLVTNLGGKLPKCAGADKERSPVSSYKDIPNQIAGCFKLVKAWHAIGHEHENPTVFAHMLKNGKTFSASLNLLNQLHLVSYRVNAMIQHADPDHYEALKKLRVEAERRHIFFKVIGSDDPLLMEGREIMYNRQTPLHPDKSDHKRGWALLLVVGPLTGSALHIPCINLRMSYTNGTMIMVRGKVLPHEVEAFSNGQRICIAHFTHRSLWKACGITPP